MNNNNLGNNDYNPRVDELIPLREAAEQSGLSTRHLRLLISRGTLWGKKFGRDWFTTAQAVREYMARDRRPGPKLSKSSD
jgi:hypothetical protein